MLKYMFKHNYIFNELELGYYQQAELVVSMSSMGNELFTNYARAAYKFNNFQMNRARA